MTWFTSSNNQTAAARSLLGLAIAVEFDFPSGMRRVSTWDATFQIDGNDFIGVGILGSVTALDESVQLVARSKTYTLNLVDQSLSAIPEADLEGCTNRPVTEYLCLFDAETRQLIDTPEVTFEGFMSKPRRVEGPTPSISIVCEHRLLMLSRPDGWRWTHEHQQHFFAGDDGFNQVKYNDLREIYWGGWRVMPGGRGGGGGPQLDPYGHYAKR